MGAPRRSQIVLASLRSDRPTADYCSARSRASSASAGCGDGATSAEEALALAIETEVELTDRDGREFRGSRPQLPMQVTIAGRRSSAAGRGRLLHRECWPQGMRRLEAIGGRSGLGKPMPNRSPTTRCNNTTTAASTLPGHGSRARAAARHHADCPVSPLTQLCPLSSAPFSIVKSMYLGQVSSQVSAVFVCL